MARTLESKVGVFFLIGLAILALITFKAEDLGALLKRRDHFTANFPHASGLKPGDTVAIAGLKVGEIETIRLTDTGVEVALAVERSQSGRIRDDATCAIVWRGLLGDRYLDITPGSPQAAAKPPGSVIKSTKSVEFDQVVLKLDDAVSEIQGLFTQDQVGAKIAGVMDNLQEITDSIKSGKGTVGKLVSDEALYQNLTAVAQDLRDQKGAIGKLIASDELYTKALGVVDDLKGASERINKLVGNNDERLAKIVQDVEAAVPEAKEAFAGIRRLSEKVEAGDGILPALVNDKAMRENLQNALNRLSASLDKIEDFAASLKDGKGLVGKLTQDEQLASDVQAAAKNLSAVSERIANGDGTLARLTRDGDLYDDVKKLVDDLRETLRRVKEQVPVGTFASVLMSAF